MTRFKAGLACLVTCVSSACVLAAGAAATVVSAYSPDALFVQPEEMTEQDVEEVKEADKPQDVQVTEEPTLVEETKPEEVPEAEEAVEDLAKSDATTLAMVLPVPIKVN